MAVPQHTPASLAFIMVSICGVATVVSAQNVTSMRKNFTDSTPIIFPEDGVPSCRLSSTDPYVHNKIQEILSYKVKLLEYELEFADYEVNPLTVDTKWTYRGYKWARAYSQHGQTLLSLAFNYGIMSLMTLTLGVENMHIPLQDSPRGCIFTLSEQQKVSAVLFLLMRDFQDQATEITLEDQERICHEVISEESGSAKFTDQCCHMDPITERLTCTTDIINIWLQLLFFLLTSVKVGLLFYGPIYFIPLVRSLVKQNIPYMVKLKDPLHQKIFVCKSDTYINKTYKRILDLRGKTGYPKFAESVKSIPLAETVKVTISRYDIMVNYSRLLIENNVPVGVFSSVRDAVCKCRIGEIGPFRACCHTDICKSVYSMDKEITWFDLCSQFTKVLSVLLLPLPFYIRLVLYYLFEADDIHAKQEMLASLGLKSSFDGGLMTHLTPTHPVYVTVYILYFTLFLVFVMLPKRQKSELVRILYDSFRDLKHMSWLDALAVFVGNMIWPYKRYGILGCILAPLYWLGVFPISILVYGIYCIPTFYIPVRMIVHACRQNVEPKASTDRYIFEVEKDRSMHNFETEALYQHFKNSSDMLNNIASERTKTKLFRFDICVNLLLALLCILTMYGMLLLLSECIGFTVELTIFTLMGVIVNAGSVFKYVTLLILVVLYSFDCYKNVGKKYLKLNKALFNELKSRCKDIEEVTSLPSHLQENYGFKSQELSEQADHELPDALDDCKPGHWIINDLVLFVDNQDMPRIPKKLFEEVCQISVAGAPGPVHQSLIAATQDFFKILLFILFVFIVVLTFGTVYKVSSTNQMLAALAGGFLPFLMKTFLTPSKPNIELGTVSFKSKLDEIIKNFQQSWPIYDFAFEQYTEEMNDAMDTAITQSDCIGDVPSPGNRMQNSKIAVEDDKQGNIATRHVSFDERCLATTNLCVPEKETVHNQDDYDVDILIILPDDSEKSQSWIGPWSDLDADSLLEYGLQERYVSSSKDCIL